MKNKTISASLVTELETMLHRDDLPDDLRDLTRRLLNQHCPEQRDLRATLLLQALNAISQQMLLADTEENFVYNVIQSLGTSLHTNFLAIVEIYEQSDSQQHYYRGYWRLVHPGVYHIKTDRHPCNIRFPSRWMQALRQGTVFNSMDLTEDETNFTQQLSLDHFLIVPMMHIQDLWGFILLSDAQFQRAWPDDVIPLLSTIATLLLSGLLHRHNRATRSQKQQASYLVAEDVHDGFWDWDVAANSIVPSPSAKQVLGYRNAEIHPTPVGLFRLMHPDDRTYVESQFESFIQEEGANLQTEYRLRHHLGTYIWFSARAFAVRDVSGKAKRLIISQSDITALRHTQQTERDQRLLTQTLYSTFRALNSTLNLESILNQILTEAGKVIPYDVGTLVLLEQGIIQRMYYHVPRLGDGSHPVMDMPTIPVDAIELYQHLTHHQQVILDHSISVEAILSAWMVPPQFQTFIEGGQPGRCSYLAAPVVVAGVAIGSINLISRWTHFFTIDHQERLQSFADQVMVAIHKAQLYEQARDVAMHEERQRIASELHDVVSQTLFSANMIAEILPRVWQKDSEAGQNYLNDLHGLTRSALAEMRTLLVELRPEAMHKTTLKELLSQLCESFSQRNQTALQYRALGEPHMLPPEVQTAFYRIAQEALNNITKHARASSVEVILQFTERQVGLMVRDNGAGFDTFSIPNNHFGIQIMHERAERIGAYLNIYSKVDEGTQIKLTWSNLPQ